MMKKRNMAEERNSDFNGGTYWFDRFVNDCTKLSPHIDFRPIKHGFYRIYWVGSGHPAYLGECFREMPEVGYNIEDLNQNLEESKRYYEEFKEDDAEYVRTVKNFVEGYWENLDRIKTRVYLFKNNDEFRKNAIERYKTAVIK